MAKPKQAQQAANSTITAANNSSFTVWSPQDTVRDVAESLGISNISDDVLRSLAMDVEYRILEIIEQAVKFKRHSKRETLTSDDVSKALKVLNVEPLYGYAPGISVKNFTNTQVGTGQQQQNLYCLNDEEIDFDELINEPLPPAPRLPSFTAHWLAVEGVQPAIPQNPNLSEIRHKYPPVVRGAIVTSVNENSLQTIVPDEEEIEENEDKSVGATITKDSDAQNHVLQDGKKTLNSLTGSNLSKTIIKPGSKELEVKPRVKHVLSKELQIYFEKVCKSLLDQENTPEHIRLRSAALHSLKNDTGLHQLVPYFISFISEQITYNLENLGVLASILEMMYSLLSNDSIFLDPYIHTLMPSILTLLLAKTLGNEENTLDQTLGLRDFASELLNHVLQKFPKLDRTLKPRLTRTFLKSFLDTNRTMGTYYGCFKGVMVLGTETVRFFIGNIHNWAELVLPVSVKTGISTISSKDSENKQSSQEVEASKSEDDPKNDIDSEKEQNEDVEMEEQNDSGKDGEVELELEKNEVKESNTAVDHQQEETNESSDVPLSDNHKDDKIETSHENKNDQGSSEEGTAKDISEKDETHLTIECASRFSKEEIEHLVAVVIAFLKTLEKELPLVQPVEEKTLSANEVSRLENLLGKVITNGILKLDSEIEIRKLYNAIFFGELKA